MTEKHRRRWLRFSLRTMLVLVTLVCIYLAWAMNWIRERRDFPRASSQPASGMYFERGETPAPWRLRWLGEAGVTSIHCSQKNETKRAVSKLFPEAKVYGVLDCPLYGSSFPPDGYFEAYWQDGEYYSFYE